MCDFGHPNDNRNGQNVLLLFLYVRISQSEVFDILNEDMDILIPKWMMTGISTRLKRQNTIATMLRLIPVLKQLISQKDDQGYN